MTAILKKERKKEGTMIIEGVETKKRERVKFELNLGEAVAVPEGEELFKLSARLGLSEMEGEEKRGLLRMREVSLKYGVLCSETSWVAIERLKTKVEGEAKPVLIPISLSKDSQHNGPSVIGSKLKERKKDKLRSGGAASGGPLE